MAIQKNSAFMVCHSAECALRCRVTPSLLWQRSRGWHGAQPGVILLTKHQATDRDRHPGRKGERDEEGGREGEREKGEEGLGVLGDSSSSSMEQIYGRKDLLS